MCITHYAGNTWAEVGFPLISSAPTEMLFFFKLEISALTSKLLSRNLMQKVEYNSENPIFGLLASLTRVLGQMKYAAIISIKPPEQPHQLHNFNKCVSFALAFCISIYAPLQDSNILTAALYNYTLHYTHIVGYWV